MTNLAGASGGLTADYGYNANGGYVRIFEAGELVMQICTRRQTSTAYAATVTFPLAFPDEDDLSVQVGTSRVNTWLAQNPVDDVYYTSRSTAISSGATVTATLSYTATWINGA